MATQAIKDILDTEIPSPSWVWSPTRSTPLDTDMTFARNSVGFTREYPTINYTSRSVDTPRISQGNSLLLERESTNFVLSSSDISQNSTALGASDSVSLSSPAREIIQDPDADSKFVESGGAENDRYRMDCSGTLSGGIEVASVYAAAGTSGKVRCIFSGTSVEVDFSTETHTVLRDSNNMLVSVNKRFFLNPRTGNNKVCLLIITVDTAGSTSESRRLDVGPASSTAGESVVFYHGQIETGNRSSPILTSGSTATREREPLSINPKDWWNNKAGTFLIKIVPQSFRTPFTQKLLRAPGKEWINITGSTSPYSIGSFDGSTGVGHSKSTLNAFETGKVAISLTSNQRRLAINSVVETFQHNGDLLSKPSEINVGDGGKALSRIKSITYFPDALTPNQLEILTT